MIDLYRVNTRQAQSMMVDILQVGLVPYLQSSPGMGKSSIAANISDQLNTKLIDHRLSTSEPTDMTGLPYFKPNGTAAFAPFEEMFPLENTPLPEGKNGWMVLLDEFNSASRETQAAAYKIILDKMVGQIPLNENVALVAAGNLDTDRAITNKMSTAMQSRLVHLELHLDHEIWLEDVALAQSYDPRIIAFLNYNKPALMDFKPDHKEKTFCCPRTWEFMNRLVQNKPVIKDEHAALFAGTITSGIAAEFVTYNQIYRDLVDIKTILAAPVHAPLPETAQAQWACITNLMSNITKDNFEHLSIYANRFTITFRVLFFRSILIRQPALRNHPAFASVMSEVARYMTSNV